MREFFEKITGYIKVQVFLNENARQNFFDKIKKNYSLTYQIMLAFFSVFCLIFYFLYPKKITLHIKTSLQVFCALLIVIVLIYFFASLFLLIKKRRKILSPNENYTLIERIRRFSLGWYIIFNSLSDRFFSYLLVINFLLFSCSGTFILFFHSSIILQLRVVYYAILLLLTINSYLFCYYYHLTYTPKEIKQPEKSEPQDLKRQKKMSPEYKTSVKLVRISLFLSIVFLLLMFVETCNITLKNYLDGVKIGISILIILPIFIFAWPQKQSFKNAFKIGFDKLNYRDDNIRGLDSNNKYCFNISNLENIIENEKQLNILFYRYSMYNYYQEFQSSSGLLNTITGVLFQVLVWILLKCFN